MSRYSFMVISLALFAVGLFIAFNSVGWGSGAANAYLRSQGGGMDTAQFTVVLQGYIDMYRWLGSILALTGGLGFAKAVELR